ncbi:MAG TPA: DnaJ domain-containing protein [Cyclobacteriaceae bacterium]
MKDYYEILGVSPASSSAEIRRIYRRLALQYHPDKNPSPEAQATFQEINEAYEILGDEENRRRYDLKRQAPSTPDLTPDDIYAHASPAYRDPAYRRRQPQSATPRVNENVEMMRRYLPYISWLTWAGLATMVIFMLDYTLPFLHSTEKVIKTTVTHVKGTSSYLVKTTNHSVRLYDGSSFENNTDVDLEYTPILQVVFKIVDHNRTEKIATSRGVYGPIFFLPLLLFSTAIAGFFLRKNIEYSFNINITLGLMCIIVIYLILRG